MAALLLVVVLVIAAVFLLKNLFGAKRSSGPSLFANVPHKGDVKAPPMTVVKTGYKGNLPKGDIDVVIIGAGTSGLVTGALLSKAGKKVVVLEQHDRAGGSLHSFEEHGYEWDTGVHYIGNIGKKHDMSRVVLDAATDGQIEWANLGDVYDRLVMTTRAGKKISVDVRSGREGFISAFESAFPGTRDQLGKYLDACAEARGATMGFVFDRLIADAKGIRWLVLKVIQWWNGGSAKFAKSNVTTEQKLNELIDDVDLRGALAYVWGDIGEPPSKSSWFIHAQLVNHYLSGAYYPIGGPMEIPRYAIPVIERSGGKVLVRCDIERIIVENGTAVGVKIADGPEVRAPIVISTAGAANTFGRLLPRDLVEAKGYGDLTTVHKASIGSTHVSLYIGLEGSSRENKLPGFNTWIFPSSDHDANISNCLRDPLNALSMFFISFPSAKDPDYDVRHPNGGSVAEVLSLAPYDFFQGFEGEPVKHRGNEYNGFKEKMAQQMLKELYAHFPQLKNKVKYYEVGTPITTKYYLASQGGASYGLEHTPERFGDIRLRSTTNIPGLFLSGQDTFSVGVVSGIMAGLTTASTVLDRNLIDEVVAEMGVRRRQTAGKSKTA